MKLYKVTVEYTIMVVAENEREAELHSRYITIDEEPDFTYIDPVFTTKDVPNHLLDSYPFGNNPYDYNVQEWMNVINIPEPPEPPDPNQIPLFNV